VKKLPFTERVTGYLQFEAFNVFNTQYDTSRRTDEYSLISGTTNLNFIGSYGTAVRRYQPGWYYRAARSV